MLAIEQLTVGVVAELREAGIPSVVLKGAPLVRRLYELHELRPSVDVDILVPPARHGEATRVLERAGFADTDPGAFGSDEAKHAVTLARRDGVVDLNRTLPFVAGDPDAVWRAISREVREVAIAGSPVPAMSDAALAFHVALHAAQHGAATAKPVRDLERALDRIPPPGWSAARDLAAELGALDYFAAGLRLVEPGRAVASRLDLPRELPVAVELRAQTPPPTALAWEALLRAEGGAAKLRLIGRAVAPRPGYVRFWSRRRVRRDVPLPLLYLYRPLWLLGRTGAALRALYRTRRRTR